MLNTVYAAEKPERVVLDVLPEGGSWVSLRANAAEEEVTRTGEEKSTSWKADQVQFRLPEDRAETKESVTEKFEAWWEYGKGWTPKSDAPPTVLDRLAVIEETVNALIGM